MAGHRWICKNSQCLPMTTAGNGDIASFSHSISQSKPKKEVQHQPTSLLRDERSRDEEYNKYLRNRGEIQQIFAKRICFFTKLQFLRTI